MKIRTVILGAGAVGTLILTQLAGAGIAQPNPDPMSGARQLLAAYVQTNAKLANCMRAKGLSYDGGVVKSDVVDAFQDIPANQLSAKDRNEISALTRATPDDPNAKAFAAMSASDQARWAGAVNACSIEVDRQSAGGADMAAKIAKLQQDALASPQVRDAAQAYAGCMSGRGYTVARDPFEAPQGVMDAEHDDSADARSLVARYDEAWRACVTPYQQVLDRAMYG
jgi:hypothetical protein